MKVLIVEDEKLNTERLKKLLASLDLSIEIVGNCTSIEDTIQWLKENTMPELIFLDIELSDGISFKIFEHVKINAEIIFVTAYNEYAIDAIKVGAMDYILKPVKLQELKIAIEKVNIRMETKAQPQPNIQELMHSIKSTHPTQKLAINSLTGTEFIDLDGVLYFESDSNYTSLFLSSGKTIVASKTLKEFENLVVGKGFYRIQNRYLVNLKSIVKFQSVNGGEVVLSNGAIIPVGKDKKKELFALLSLN